MARWRERVPLESGLKLDIDRLIRDDIMRPGEHSICRVTWRTGDGYIRDTARTVAEMRPGQYPRLCIEHSDGKQDISLCFAYRHFGGRQWYFTCPKTHDRVRVLWKPPGSPYFASRQAFGRQVAYGSQFETPRDRALTAARKIRRRLGGDHWTSILDGFPAKPKGMRWRTYNRLIDECEAREDFALASVYMHLRKLAS